MRTAADTTAGCAQIGCAAAIGTGRTPAACGQRYRSYLAATASDSFVVRISGCSTHRMLPNCDGDYACSGRRNGRPCFTRHSGALPAGAIYFDGEHWKVCLVGDGASEHGWNFSQRPLADDPVSLPPAGFWSAARASADDTPISYGGVRLEVLSAAGNHPIAGRFGLYTFSAGNIARRLRQQQQQQQRQRQQQAGGGCGATARRVRQPRPLPSARPNACAERVLSQMGVGRRREHGA